VNTRRAEARAAAKINMWLGVRGRRPDGHHDIETIFHEVDLCDDLSVAITDHGEVELAMQLNHFDDVAPKAADNLAFRAAEALRVVAGCSNGVAISIAKRIPIAAGLGGGSSDAATVLILLGRLLGGLADSSLQEVAAALGSDVSFFLRGGTAVGTGRGDRLTEVASPRMDFVLGFSRPGLATSDTYAEWDRLTQEPAAGSEQMQRALASGDRQEIGSLMHNDLEAAAVSLRPELAARRERMLEAGALGAIVSGSGPTVVGLANDDVHARRIAERIRDAFEGVALTSSAAGVDRLLGGSRQ
jgi:4-diphosphocytidyl-2-C-methyl-D-erythritol kinase